MANLEPATLWPVGDNENGRDDVTVAAINPIPSSGLQTIQTHLTRFLHPLFATSVHY